MKNIAVFAHNLSVEYAITVIKGIADFYKDKDVHILITQTFQKDYKLGMFDYQFWATTKLLNSDNIDGFIIISGSYTTSCTTEEQLEFFKSYSKKPTLSISINPKLEGVYYTVSNCDQAYDDIINHLKNEHGCKRIGFISALQTQSEEAIQRYESYKKALKKHDLEFDESIVYDGRFTQGSILSLFPEVLKTKEDIHFDALISSNDMMCAGALEYLISIGVKVPEEVKLIGFDNTSHASMCEPTLSTIDQQISKQGYHGAEVMWNILQGKNINYKNKTELKPIYRQSCGCIPIDNKDLSYKDNSGEIFHPSKTNQQLLNQYLSLLSDMNAVPSLVDLLRADRTLQELSYNLKFILELAGLSSIAVCFYDEPFCVKRNEDFILPDNSRLYIFRDSEKEQMDFYDEGIDFDSRKNIIPELLWQNNPGQYIFYPIFSADKQYGYTICKMKNSNYASVNVYLRIIIHSLAQAFIYTKALKEKETLSIENQRLLNNNSDLNLKSKMDELTKIFNRRGLLQYGQQLINFSLEMETKGLVIFADMDGLKTINDTFGHKIGDVSIETEAKVLKESFRKSDIVGRLSGDEFAVIAPGLTFEIFEKCRKKVVETNKKYSQKAGLQFELSISLGAVEFSNENSNLAELLQQADKKLYEEKKIKHSRKEQAKKSKS